MTPAAAIGRVQLRRLPDVVARRQSIAGQLAEGVAGVLTFSLPALIPGSQPSYWFLRLRFHAESATCDRDTFCAALLAEGLPITPHYRAALPHPGMVHRAACSAAAATRGPARTTKATAGAVSLPQRPWRHGHALQPASARKLGAGEVDAALAILHKVDAADRIR